MDNKDCQSQSDNALNTIVYVTLLALTALTLAASIFNHLGRLMTISIALIIATAKASMIGFYYMDLRRERTMMYVILAIGLLSVLILFVGIAPDMTFQRF